MLEKQLNFIREKTDFIPQTALVLGSGLGALADEIEQIYTIDYRDIPDFPVSTAPGHRGRFVLGKIGRKNVIIMQGRIHLYEGYAAQEIAQPIRLMRELGAQTLFLTNAAGGINRSFAPGDLMLVSDHISSFVPSPLIGKNDPETGPRFPDMSEVYSPRLNSIIEKTAQKNNIIIKKGVYLQFRGPCFETPSEIKMAEILGADAVGMSTAVEAQAAKHCGFEVCALSVISNMACGISKKPLSGDDVEETANKTAPVFKKLIKESVKEF